MQRARSFTPQELYLLAYEPANKQVNKVLKNALVGLQINVGHPPLVSLGGKLPSCDFSPLPREGGIYL